MEIASQHPLVSVAVITYNSAQYIIDTLDSIKNQTYDSIELVISDDCSSDNTIKICQEWIDHNKSRFKNIHIVQSLINTGQSGNYNRAFNACNGEWVKEIDGDDILLPNCITDFIIYTQENTSAKYIFGKMLFLGDEGERYKQIQNIFDYSFFLMTQTEQLHYLIFKNNCIPSPTTFYNRKYIMELGFKHDERIPLMEDYPKWIRLLQLGVRFHFLEKDVVKYRVNSGISTKQLLSAPYYKSTLLFDLYYRWPMWINQDYERGVKRIIDNQMIIYQNLLDTTAEIKRIKNTYAFRLGKLILHPLSTLYRIINSIIHKSGSDT